MELIQLVRCADPFLKPFEWLYIDYGKKRKVFVYLSVSRWVAFCRSEAGRVRVFGPGAVIL